MICGADNRVAIEEFGLAKEEWFTDYMVSAWAQQNNLVLGQIKADDKSNEITAIPKLLSRLDIAGAVITIDTMGCQKNSWAD